MPTSFKSVVLVGKRRDEKNILSTLLKLKKHLEKKSLTVFIEQQTSELFNLKHSKILAEKDFKKNIELIIVVGGDGSLLNAALSAVNQQLPILGINRGKLGFLTDILPDNFTELDQVISGKYKIEKRFLLKASVTRNNKNKSSKPLCEMLALNDLVLSPGNTTHMIEFAIDIDNEFMCTQRADGLIISTPTGSTAYALSGGGPILHPELNAVVLVPMFPHKLTSRPIVISGKSHIQISLSHDSTCAKLSADSQNSFNLQPNDTIHIQPFHKSLTLIHPLSYQYFSTLRSKLHWENKPY